MGLGKLGWLTLLRLFLGPRGQWVPCPGVPMECRWGADEASPRARGGAILRGSVDALKR